MARGARRTIGAFPTPLGAVSRFPTRGIRPARPDVVGRPVPTTERPTTPVSPTRRRFPEVSIPERDWARQGQLARPEFPRRDEFAGILAELRNIQTYEQFSALLTRWGVDISGLRERMAGLARR